VNSNPHIHADDFGLTKSINRAILDLTESNYLQGASILVNGNAVESAIKQWKRKPNFSLCLHLCLTEGLPVSNPKNIPQLINKNGLLSLSFGILLIYSLLPRNNILRRKLEKQLRHEIKEQIIIYKKLTGNKTISIDGHQHIHLIPIVLDIILDISTEYKIDWIRTTKEKFELNLFWDNWKSILLSTRIIKWLILQILSYLSKKNIEKSNISTNVSFSGILFTGHMSKTVISNAINQLNRVKYSLPKTKPVLLIHPSEVLNEIELKSGLLNFPISRNFVLSKWRQKELNSIKNIFLK